MVNARQELRYWTAPMKPERTERPISYLQEHAAEALEEVRGGKEVLVITEDGEARAVLQDIRAFEDMQRTLALLKMLAVSSADVREGRVRPFAEAFARVRREGSGK